jgi:protease-4
MARALIRKLQERFPASHVSCFGVGPFLKVNVAFHGPKHTVRRGVCFSASACLTSPFLAFEELTEQESICYGPVGFFVHSNLRGKFSEIRRVKMSSKRNVAFILLFGAAFFITVAAIIFYFVLVFYYERDGVTLGEAVAIVELHGEIRYDLSKVDELDSYRENGRIKAVLLHINSPGGGVAATQEIYHAVQRLKHEKPVVAFLSGIAASGGYYIACAADSIVSLEGTLTGSIGVVAAFLHTEELYQKIGLGVTVIKSGKFKDIGSPHRQMTSEEKQYMERLLDNVYSQFLQAVSNGRGMPIAEVTEIAEGRLFTGEEARDHGLVDRLGTYDSAILMAAEMGGIEGEAKIVKKRKRKPLFGNFFRHMNATIPLEADSHVTLKYIIP